MQKMTLGVLLITLLVQCTQKKSPSETPAPSTADISASIETVSATFDSFGINVNKYEIRNFSVKKNESLYILLQKLDLNQSQIYRAIQKAKEVIDVRAFKPNQSYRAYISEENNKLEKIVWEPNSVEFVTFNWEQDSVEISRASRVVTTKTKSISGTITSSLYNAISDKSSRDELVYKLSDILAWQVDFFNLRKGDTFKILYENKYVDGEHIDVGDIKALELKHMGDTYFAYYFQNDEIEGYYDEVGNSVQKALLKAPFTYDQRISSGFNPNRFHPVLKRRRPHNGVDYAAPYGTPVLSVGDGTVSRAGYYGSAGRMVEVEYHGSFKAKYMHLSRFAKGVGSGTHVKQGEVIGYVGNTGRVTGTHLHYELIRNDRPINPLTVDLPASEAIPQEYMPSFLRVRDRLNRQMFGNLPLAVDTSSVRVEP